MLEVIRTDDVDHIDSAYVRIVKSPGPGDELWEYIIYLGGITKDWSGGYKTKEEALSEARLFINSFKENLAH